MSREIFNRFSVLFSSNLNAMICRRSLMVFVILRECGPGTSVTGYVCPTTKRLGISRI